MSGKIIINRKNEWVNSRTSYRVLIDGNEVGVIKNGSSEEFIIEPGAHSVTLKLGIYSGVTMTLILLSNQTIYLKTHSAWKFFKLFQTLFFIVLVLNLAPFYRPKGNHREYHFDSTKYIHLLEANNIFLLEAILISPLLLSYLYHLTIGRKKYIILERDDDNIFNS